MNKAWSAGTPPAAVNAPYKLARIRAVEEKKPRLKPNTRPAGPTAHTPNK